MPLQAGSNQETISQNISELINAGYDPDQASAIAYSEAAKDSGSARVTDLNGWVEIKGNPITKVGVFPYKGVQIDPEGSMGLDPNIIYQVYRPEEELDNQETIDSFKLVPWIDGHVMLGEGVGLTLPENKGIDGITGQDVYFEFPYLKSNLKVFSSKLPNEIDGNEKKELSIGYRCRYDMQSGVYEGQPYDVIQRKIRGNHVALVEEGRAGSDVAVLDHFKFTFDSGELTMNPENEKKDTVTLQSLQDEMKSMRDELATLRGNSAAAAAKDADTDKKEDEEKDKDADVKDEDPAMFVTKAQSTDEDPKDKEKDKDGMDAAIESHVNQKFKKFMRELNSRNALAQELSRYVGSFDHADKTRDEVAQYGVKKLGIQCHAGQEFATLQGYFAAKKQTQAVAVAQDNALPCDQISKYINGGA